jgi:hypothetical protein
MVGDVALGLQPRDDAPRRWRSVPAQSMGLRGIEGLSPLVPSSLVFYPLGASTKLSFDNFWPLGNF